MKVAPTRTRTFLIEKDGSGNYTLVKMWEKGSPFTQDDFKLAMKGVPDGGESIVAEQTVSIRSTKRGVEIEGTEQTIREATRVAEFVITGRAQKQ